MQAINKENTMGQFPPKVPVYIWLGTTDELMPMADTEAVVSAYCAAGTTVQFKKLAGIDHVAGATYLGGGLDYLVDRFNGKAAPNTCK
jgi:predicted esterase